MVAGLGVPIFGVFMVLIYTLVRYGVNSAYIKSCFYVSNTK